MKRIIVRFERFFESKSNNIENSSPILSHAHIVRNVLIF